ncbi:hypothetical protein CERSUDRAFT_99798 [Gelatoporia subvermispora B]|uniref:Uncharacterized protein n=1 Tax=Ceriporiopsis subvermispora (strain B) TaxID=914234 RepID=M2Q5M1_CERS8|nr:hypothetical protein CERSUDRAFT_99798 [Gelatoporia subvermispora B]
MSAFTRSASPRDFNVRLPTKLTLLWPSFRRDHTLSDPTGSGAVAPIPVRGMLRQQSAWNQASTYIIMDFTSSPHLLPIREGQCLCITNESNVIVHLESVYKIERDFIVFYAPIHPIGDRAAYIQVPARYAGVGLWAYIYFHLFYHHLPHTVRTPGPYLGQLVVPSQTNFSARFRTWLPKFGRFGDHM